MGIIERSCGRENDITRGEAECVIVYGDRNAFNNICSIIA